MGGGDFEGGGKMMIKLFRMSIEPMRYSAQDHAGYTTVQIKIDTDVDSVATEKHMRLDSFESEFDWMMRSATEDINRYVDKLKEDKKMRAMSAEEMQQHIEAKLKETP